ncbi:erythromycin esterase family protein [Ramlibacter sp. USB13]|uniref:Erythromycin esterase family protein n=1 Tax=Ramlibacter cellulosilyticus TaxID=2764187 RepID=A0A923MS20_9BURK|nr:erythromycin esterase family protein [Ramlibacter cellulosilyticus]MBC5783554.1 erythromycin esterase family protein [Ramlibacter cellulosilyticus]
MAHPSSTRQDRLLEQLRPHLRALPESVADDELLVERLAGAKLALLGEASHGTHEFYAERAWLTQRLIRDHGFNAVVVEADWPDAWRVNRYVRWRSDDRGAEQALSGFERFPTWMWRNTVVRDFVEWLREHNHALPPSQQCGFYGMDLYSLYSSIRAVLDYLDRADPEAAQRARSRYACFDHYGEDSQAYGYAASFGMKSSCEDEVIQQLREMNRRSAEMFAASGEDRADLFFAQQNARLVRNAEEYYRTMFHGRVSSWNLRDSHMVETLQALEKHLENLHGHVRMAVWAHNSHLGDASATEMGDIGEWNVGQLARDRWGDDAMLVGFSTHSGTVTAASEWDAAAERKRVRPGLPGSYEDLFHQVGEARFWLPLKGNAALRDLLQEKMLQRAIGVIYQPRTERQSHYFHTRLPAQFDAMIHIDHTRALEPLVREPLWHAGEAAETYPSGL